MLKSGVFQGSFQGEHHQRSLAKSSGLLYGNISTFEFVGANSDEKKKEVVLDDLKQFFVRLFSKYSIL